MKLPIRNTCADSAVSPVIAVILLVAMIVTSIAVIGIIVIDYTQDSVAAKPNLQVRASADNTLIYHAGGSVIELSNLRIYTANGSELKTADILINNASGRTTWSTGETIQSNLSGDPISSIVAPDRNGNDVLLYYMSPMVLTGDMVPDTWVVPTPVPKDSIWDYIKSNFTIGISKGGKSLKYTYNLTTLNTTSFNNITIYYRFNYPSNPLSPVNGSNIIEYRSSPETIEEEIEIDLDKNVQTYFTGQSYLCVSITVNRSGHDPSIFSIGPIYNISNNQNNYTWNISRNDSDGIDFTLVS
jgi:flagellin-like protein